MKGVKWTSEQETQDHPEREEHQCSIFIKSATKDDTGLFNFYSNYGWLISLVVNEWSAVIGSPDDTDFDWKLALSIILPTLAVVLVVVSVKALK